MISFKISRFFCLSKTIPTIDLSSYLSKKTDLQTQSQLAAEILSKYGILIVKDPRVEEKHNQNFLNLFEKYYQSRSIQKERKQKIDEEFIEYGHQTGVTPDFIEQARTFPEFIDTLPEKHKPKTPKESILDPKWRYLWRIGEKDPNEKESKIDPPRVAPKDFPEFASISDNWGNLMLNSVFTVSSMLELGLGLKKGSFTDRLNYGVHVLGPTGSNLDKYKKGTVFAGLHYDISFLTIHGKSKFPGLFVWLRNGEKMSVKIPDGCLLLQAGREIEYFTAGFIKAGMHEVVYTEETEKSVEIARKKGESLWRVSSTLFSHVKGSCMLEPLETFKERNEAGNYKKITAEEHTIEELSYIKLM